MPKMKTHSGAKKRFRVTGSGKISHQRANRRHYLEHKPSRRTRRLKPNTLLSAGKVKAVKRMLGLG